MDDAIKTASEVMAKAKENFDAIGENALDGNVNADALVQVCARMSSRLEEAMNELAVAQLADETETEPSNADTTLRRALESIVGLEKAMDESISKAGYQTGGEAGSCFYKALRIAHKALGTN